jgi:hypothetical protein
MCRHETYPTTPQLSDFGSPKGAAVQKAGLTSSVRQPCMAHRLAARSVAPLGLCSCWVHVACVAAAVNGRPSQHPANAVSGGREFANALLPPYFG